MKFIIVLFSLFHCDTVPKIYFTGGETTIQTKKRFSKDELLGNLIVGNTDAPKDCMCIGVIQKDTTPKRTADTLPAGFIKMIGGGGSTNAPVDIYDTVLCVMLCVDTSMHYAIIYNHFEVDTTQNNDTTETILPWLIHFNNDTVSRWREKMTFTEYGYAVRLRRSITTFYNASSRNPLQDYYWEITEYLDTGLKPFKYFVWMAQVLKK